MKLPSVISYLSLGTSLASLVVVYGLSIYWPALIALPATLLFWLLTKRRTSFWRASALLCVYLGLALTAMLLNRPLVPLELGCVAALIWWDVQDFGLAEWSRVPAWAATSLQKYRLQSLAFTAGASLLLAGAAFSLRIELPFGVVAVLILLITGCLVLAVGVLRNPPLSRE